MMTETRLPTWAPRLKAYLIRRLYEKDAAGIQDDELLEQVGWALHARCQSFVWAMEATQGRAHCPACSQVVVHHLKSQETLHCSGCGWECTWRDYWKTIRNQQLNGGPEVVAIFQDFVEQFPRAQAYPEKMILVDQLIHSFHHYLRSGRTRRPVAVNLLDGSLEFVLNFLDELSYRPGSASG